MASYSCSATSNGQSEWEREEENEDEQEYEPTRSLSGGPMMIERLLICAIAISRLLDLAYAGDGLIQPQDLAYEGAFRLPDGPPEVGWEWSGEAMAYCPKGDPRGPDDGYPGSIFGTGHNWNQHVSEISIPKPVVSRSKTLSELNTARTLQGFHRVRSDFYGYLEIPRAGLAYLPKQGRQTTDKLYFCWAPHMGEQEKNPTHGWCELDLAKPMSAGPWGIGGYTNYATTDYIFVIPKEWAAANTHGMRLATGRFRDGGQGGQGPNLFAYGPWHDGNPPARGAQVKATKLLQYDTVYTDGQRKLRGYHHSEQWTGGAWLTAGSKSAVVFVGTKGQGKCWYGFANGVVWPDEAPFPKIPDPPNDDRGWWSTSFVGQMLFYSPADLAAVAKGKMEPNEPQPYAALDIDDVLFSVKSKQQRYHVGAASFDRKRGLLYVFEPRGDEDKSLVHVWRVKGE